jgi:hypothetical protein
VNSALACGPVPLRVNASTTLQVEVDPVEHQRRQTDHLGGITNWDVLGLLMELPVGEPIQVGDLDWGKRPILRKIPAGAADLTRTHVTRLAVKPCRVHRAIVTGPATRRSLERAGRWAPFCARTVLISKPPRSATFLTEADYWGIGVTLDRGDGQHEVLVPEKPWMPKRHTLAGWRFVEQQYQRATAGEG